MAVTNGRTGKPLSASTVHATLTGLRAFFVWLADQRGYASRIKYADAEYFNTSDNLPRIPTARRFKSCPTLAQVRAMIEAMGAGRMSSGVPGRCRLRDPVRRPRSGDHFVSSEAHRH
ncbi:MAG: hypothetical protein WB715_26090 [Roseiarcus sp.]|uniref:hypothetical protein n=1 Tax=Roseiarcus sp. TaxID=1969460 RepID=UPI003C4C9FCB